ncbi:MAG: hypothetical protein JSS57_17200 [Proteobacteria bacterium]|nr:hypothetical protein [Pseudomonadota bacterium]
MLKVLNVIAELIAGFSRWFFSTRIPLWLGTVACLVFILFGIGQCGAKVGAQQAAKKAENARALAEKNLGTCRVNNGALETAMKQTKASMQAVEDEGKKRLETSEKALNKALRGRKEAERIALDLIKAQPGKTVCERVEQVDETLLRSLR